MNDEQLANALREIGGLCDEHDSIVDQLAAVTADRDIKAANLQMLVDKVLAADLLDLSIGRDISPSCEAAEYEMLKELIELARGLKQ